MSIVAGGVESMSRVPMGGFNPSFNPKLINNPEGVEACCGHAGRTTTAFGQSYIPMGLTAENLAKKYGISREEQDRFALAQPPARHRRHRLGHLRARDRPRARCPMASNSPPTRARAATPRWSASPR